jgi:hypothetical protein
MKERLPFASHHVNNAGEAFNTVDDVNNSFNERTTNNSSQLR